LKQGIAGMKIAAPNFLIQIYSRNKIYKTNFIQEDPDAIQVSQPNALSNLHFGLFTSTSTSTAAISAQ
jgi:hypothetical protein